EPGACHHLSTFQLPLMTLEHHRAQDRLATIQGRANLHFAGDWTRDIGSHEDAVASSLEACRRMDPGLPRIKGLEAPRPHPAMTALPAHSPSLCPIRRSGGIYV